MKVLTFLCALVSFISTSAMAMFDGPAPTVPGGLPSYLEAPQQDVIKLISEIEKQGWIGASEISLDSLRHPGDKVAYDKAIDIFSRRMGWAIYELSELKRNVIRYSVIVNQANLSKEKVMLITDTSSKINQNHYFRAIWSLAGSANEENDALSLCVSEVCVIEVADAFEEMTRFTAQINRDLDFRKLTADKSLFWRFDRPILKASFSKTFRAMIPNNKDHNAYKVLAAGIVTPLSVAGVTTVDLLKAAGSAVFNPRYSNIQLTVEEVRLDYGKTEKFHKSLFVANYQDTANGSRAAEWAKKQAEMVPVKLGTSAVEKPTTVPVATEACSKMIELAAAKHRAELDLVMANVSKIPDQMADLERFQKSLSTDQLKGIKDYASGYESLKSSGRDTATIETNDSKMREYLFYALTPNLKDAISHTRTASCEGSGYYVRYRNQHDDGQPKNVGPSAWASVKDECFYDYNGTGTSDNPRPSQNRIVFLELVSGRVLFWSCTSTNRKPEAEYFVRSCSGIDLVSGFTYGSSFADSLRLPAVASAQVPARLALTSDQFVRQEIPSCFTAAK